MRVVSTNLCNSLMQINARLNYTLKTNRKFIKRNSGLFSNRAPFSYLWPLWQMGYAKFALSSWVIMTYHNKTQVEKYHYFPLKKKKKKKILTASNIGLLLLTSSTPTMTRAVETRGCGPPDVLSSVAVTFKTYSRPWSLGRGEERRRINPTKTTSPLNYGL